MNQNQTLKISTNKQEWLIFIKTCNQKSDGAFIRELTKEDFYDYLRNTIGWNENRHCQEPKFPERYFMLFKENERIGFLSSREQPNCLYLETLQLIRQYRGHGIGTALMIFVEEIAINKAKIDILPSRDARVFFWKRDKIQLRVFKDNPAQSLYHRMGFKIVEDEGWCFLMEKVLEIC